MDLSDLDLFLAVVRSGSISRAAATLRLTQPTVSRRIQRLEAELGEEILLRGPTSVTPTRAGALLVRFAETVVAEREALFAELGRLAAVSGELAVAASTVPAEALVPELLARFRTRFPEVEAHLLVMVSAVVVDRVEKGYCDVGFTGAPPLAGALVAVPVAEDELVLAVPARHAVAREAVVTPEVLATLPFIDRQEGSGSRRVVADAFAAKGLPYPLGAVRGEAPSTHALLRAVRAGEGVGFVSRGLITPGQGVVGLPVAGLDLRRHLWLVYRRRPPRRPLAAFLRFVAEELGREVPPPVDSPTASG